jgi:chemotaxis protein CheZ
MSQDVRHRLVVDKAQLRSQFHRLQRALEDYRALLVASDDGAQDPAWTLQARSLLRRQRLELLRARVSVGTGELALALLRHVLTRLHVTELRFRPRAGDGNGHPTETAPPAPADEPPLAELVASLQVVTESAPLELQERLQRVLAGCRDFCTALAQQNAELLEAAVARVNLATANAQSRSLLREIAIVTRDVYRTLQSVSEELPLDALSGSSGGIGEAVDRLNSVVTRLEDAATQNLDQLERVNRIAVEEGARLGAVIPELVASQKRLMRLKAQHPELDAALSGIQERLSDNAGAPVMTLLHELAANSAHHMDLISNQSFQELTSRTLKKVIDFVESLEGELLDLLRRFGPVGGGAAAAAPGTAPSTPAPTGASQTQSDVDKLLGELGF